MTNRFNPEKAKYYNPLIDRKVAAITGGNIGIGFYTVLHLYLHGYTVYLLGRSQERYLKAIDKIKNEAEARVSKYTTEEKSVRFLGELHFIACDLLDLEVVSKAAESVIEKEKTLDLLINNAGLMACPYELSKDGVEVQYQVNVTAHVLLTLKLLPLIKKSKDPRIVHLASEGHRFSFKYYENTTGLKHFPDAYYSFLRYAVSKVAAINFIKLLAKKEPEILSIAVHPGIIMTDLYNHFWKRIKFLKGIAKSLGGVVSVSEEVGSYSTLRAALDGSLTPEKDNGNYLTTGGVLSSATKVASNLDNAQKTWDWNIKTLKEKGYEFDV